MPMAEQLQLPASSSYATEHVHTADLEQYEKLRKLVLYSEYLSMDMILRRIPKGVLLEIRALMYERNKMYSEALQIYVH